MSDLRLDQFIPESKTKLLPESNGQGAGAGRGDASAAEAAWQRALHQAQQDGFASWFGAPTLASGQPAFTGQLTLAHSSWASPSAGDPLAAGASGYAAAGHSAQTSGRVGDEVDADGSSSAQLSAARTASAGVDSEAATAGGAPKAKTPSSAVERTSEPTGASAVTPAPGDSAQDLLSADAQPSLVSMASGLGEPLRTANLVAVMGQIAMAPAMAVQSVDLVAPPLGTLSQERALLPTVPPEHEAHVDAADPQVESESEIGEGTAATAGEPTRSRAGDAEPLRIYAEWSEHGVKVWLGADANVTLSAETITPQLQLWLSSQGEKLLSVVCNGRLMWSEAGETTPEASAPTSAFATDVSFGDALKEKAAGTPLLDTTQPNSSETV